MGRKKADHAIGSRIIKDRFGARMTKSSDSFLHTSELQDGVDWGRLNLQSVTEQSNLDDFLATAELAGTEFTAERMNVQIVGTQHHTGLPTSEERKQTKAAEDENRKLLQIPRRPPWDETTTAEELDLLERNAFLEWRRQLAGLQENQHLTLTPFERNLDFWRQLWRVIERSDVIVQIVDARNPLLFRCEDLEAYVKEVGEDKVNVVLINKADLLTQEQRCAWAAYLDSVGIKAVFWSAVQETERCKLLQEEEAERLREEEEKEEEADTESDDEENEEGEAPEESPIEPTKENTENSKDAGNEKDSELQRSEEKREDTDAAASGDVAQSVSGDSESRDCECGAESSSADTGVDCGVSSSPGTVSEQTQDGAVPEESGTDTESAGTGAASSGGGSKNNPDLLTGDELIHILTSLHEGSTYTEGVTTLGLVGYPNVGKSSSINAILQAKKVPVSATPGRTKHFQTLYVDKTVLLCDCPGLVMPTFVSTKAEMVISGILPIDQMRDHVPPTSLVCCYIPRETLETTYGLILPQPGEDEDENRPPSAQELLSAYAYLRGFMTHKGVPDMSRAARHILKDFMNGKLLYAHPPPGIGSEEFKSAAPPQKTVRVSVADHTGQNKKSTVTCSANSVDRQFFTKTEVKMGVKGVKSALGSQPATGGSSAEGTKKHFKRGKKEKLRRIHGHADY